MFSLNHAAQLYASHPDYLRETVRLDPAPEDNALAIIMADLHAMLQAGVQTPEEAAQMSSIKFTKDVNELPTLGDIKQILSSNALQEMLMEGDSKFLSAVNAAVDGYAKANPNHTAPGTSAVTCSSSDFNKLINHAISVNDLVNHSISVNDHHWNNASAISIATNPSHTTPGTSATAPPDTSAPVHPKIHTDVESLLDRARSAENKLEALATELQQYQDWVRRALIAEGNVRDQIDQQMKAMQEELETLRPKTLELRSSSNYTRCRSPRRRKPQTHDTSQSHRDPRADRSSGT